MDFIHTHTLQTLGITLLHSIWQIALVTFIYFYLVVFIKRIPIKQKYTAGLISLALVLIAFTLTFASYKGREPVREQSSAIHLTDISPNNISSENWLNDEISETGILSTKLKSKLNSVKVLLYKFVGVVGLFWIIGIFLFLVRKIQAYSSLLKMKNNKFNVQSNKWEETLKEIARNLNLKKHVDILFSPFLNSPISFGILKPVILFPLRLTTGLSSEEIKCILIHELAHNLRNDYLFNLFQNVMEVLFFYHPGIWWISKNIRIHREIICDKIVIDTNISEKQYANTLLKLSELKLKDENLAIAAKRNTNELFTRIKHIIGKPDISKRKKGNPLIVLATIAIIMLTGFIHQSKDCFKKSSDLQNHIENKLAPYQGSFALYDFKQNKYHTFNDSLCRKRYSTFSTFKIISSLIAFDKGIAKDESYSLAYDSTKYPLPSWMKDDPFFSKWHGSHSIESALSYSVNWFFKELNFQIGYESLHEYVKKMNYGKGQISQANTAFWYNGDLKISAMEQVEFMKSLINKNYKDISEEAQILTKNLIPSRTENDFTIYGKTGTGQIFDNNYLGWYIGFIETKDNTYAYALNIQAPDASKIPGKKRQDMVIQIFSDLGLINI